MEWKEYKIGDFADVIGGGTPSTKIQEYYGGEIPWITPKDLSNHLSKYVERGERNITELGLAKSSAKLLPKGSVLFTSRAPIGYVAIAKNKVSTNQGFKSLICNETIADNEYIYYLLKSKVSEIESIATGSTFKEVSGSVLKNFIVKLPPLPIQKKIAHILSTLDEKIELNRKMNETLEAMAQAIFKSWFVDFDPVHAKARAKTKADLETQAKKLGITPEILELFPSEFEESELGMIPKGWEVKKFGDIVIPKKGKNITKKTIMPGKIPVVAGGLAPAYYHSQSNVKSPVITISASGANAGYVNLYTEDIWASDCSYINETNSDYIFSHYIFLKLKQYQITRMQQGAAQPHIYPSHLMRLDIIDCGEKLWNYYENTIKPMFNKIAENRLQIQTLQQTRDTLLPKLLSGKLDVSEVEI